MEDAGGSVEVGIDGWEIVEGRRRKQALDSKECVLAEKVFGGIETPDRMESNP